MLHYIRPSSECVNIRSVDLALNFVNGHKLHSCIPLGGWNKAEGLSLEPWSRGICPHVWVELEPWWRCMCPLVWVGLWECMCPHSWVELKLWWEDSKVSKKFNSICLSKVSLLVYHLKQFLENSSTPVLSPSFPVCLVLQGGLVLLDHRKIQSLEQC